MNQLSVRTSGSGPAVLWIHGYTMDSSTWEPLWELLPGWRHIGVDLPGHGGSDPIPCGLTLPALARQIAEIVRAEQAHRIVSLSYGSSVALQLAIDEPELVHALVAAAPTLAGAAPDADARRRYQQLMMLKPLAGPGERMADLWMASPPDIFRGTERHPQLRAALRSVIVQHSWAELDSGAMMTLSAHRHSPADLARIQARTLVFIGDEDMPAFVRNAELLRDNVADCKVVTLPRSGHLPLLERPEAVAADLAAHLLHAG